MLPLMQSWTPRTLIREGGTGLKDRWEEGEEGRGKKGRGRGSGGMANCEEAKGEGGRNITSACCDRETH